MTITTVLILMVSGAVFFGVVGFWMYHNAYARNVQNQTQNLHFENCDRGVYVKTQAGWMRK